MRTPILRIVFALALLLLSGCASRKLPKFEKPIARTQFQTVRTTAYTHTESDHVQYGRQNALGSTLLAGNVRSAAADWSRWPAGTVFRLLGSGDLYRVDDYGWAISGTNTIDLYQPSRAAMNAWGVRRVNIEVLEWGNVDRSLAILRPRGKHRHIRRMLDEIRSRYAELKRPVPTGLAVNGSAMPVGRATSTGAPLAPFMANSVR